MIETPDLPHSSGLNCRKLQVPKQSFQVHIIHKRIVKQSTTVKIPLKEDKEQQGKSVIKSIV